jgi:hypothetical protein
LERKYFKVNLTQDTSFSETPDNVSFLFPIFDNTSVCRRDLDCDKIDERILSIFDRKFLRKIFDPIRQGGQWRQRYSTELEERYNEPQ